MSVQAVWLSLAGALLVCEMLTGTFYLLMLAIGALSGAACAYLGTSLTVQLGVASLIGLAASLVVWQIRNQKQTQDGEGENPLGQLDIGSTVTVDHWNSEHACEVKYRGAAWQAVAMQGEICQPGVYRIVAIEGTTLVLKK
jgi:membrane protein implicated in regulation of membrane protease activity